LTPGLVLASLIGFTLVYGVLVVADIYLLNKFAKRGPVSEKHATGKHSINDESYWE
jgi:cytochrome d ubiquinol oxidase subunit I